MSRPRSEVAGSIPGGGGESCPYEFRAFVCQSQRRLSPCFPGPLFVPCNGVCPTFYHLLLLRTARDQSGAPGASRTRMHYQSCVRLCVAQERKGRGGGKILSRSKGKGHQRENNFQLVLGGMTCTQIQEAEKKLSAAGPCRPRLCACNNRTCDREHLV